MRSIGPITAALLARALLPSLANAAEPYEGAWVTSLKDCGDEDGFTSLTVIDLKVDVDGKATPDDKAVGRVKRPAQDKRQTISALPRDEQGWQGRPETVG